MEILLWLLLHLDTADHPKALSATSARTQIERLAIPIYGHREWECLDRLIQRESRWNPRAKNPESSARGLFQLLRMPANLTPSQQFERGRRYIEHRYQGSPCMAYRTAKDRGWY